MLWCSVQKSPDELIWTKSYRKNMTVLRQINTEISLIPRFWRKFGWSLRSCSTTCNTSCWCSSPLVTDKKSDLSFTLRSTLTTASHYAYLSTVSPSSLTSQRSQRNFELLLMKGWSMPRVSSAVRCRGFLSNQDIVNSEFNRQLFSVYDFHHGTSAHCTLKDFESVLNNPLSDLKTCELDPVPTFLVQELIDDLLYFLTVLSNSLLLEKYLPVSQESSIILPALKHDGLDQCDPANYHPHCKCHFLSKCLWAYCG